MKLEFIDRFSKNTQHKILWKYAQRWTEVFNADGRADRRITISKAVVAFLNFANAPENLTPLPSVKMADVLESDATAIDYFLFLLVWTGTLSDVVY
jgi:hypothetical protein